MNEVNPRSQGSRGESSTPGEAAPGNRGWELRGRHWQPRSERPLPGTGEPIETGDADRGDQVQHPEDADMVEPAEVALCRGAVARAAGKAGKARRSN